MSLVPVGFDPGARLRSVRELHRLSQHELARRAGVTNSTISLIEKNKNSPSLASLKKALDGLPRVLPL
ncbi:MAG: helix-turn-helix transcriptional regulator [Gammaproteobacteria bacterium]|nr:helix-turn-helix transcriptional regulator [Gammaproteobacteria bacterium]MCB1849611.1 helix-turn-helix transcriptional regulator [Gammaproteobacteria bacterium]